MANEMTARYAGTCMGCGDDFEAGTRIAYYGAGEAYHTDCRPRGAVLSEVGSWNEATSTEGFDDLFKQVELQTCLVCCTSYAKGLMCPTCFSK